VSTWPPEEQGGGAAPTGETAAVPGLTRAELQARARSGASRQSVAWESVDDTAGRRPDPDSDRYDPDLDGGDRMWFRHHPFRVVALVAVLAGVALVVGGLAWVDGQANPTGPKGAQVIVAVPQGDGTGQFAGLLQQKGVIGNSLAYRIWSKLHSSPTIYAGSYAFNKNDSFGDVASVLAGGPNVFSLVVPPGFTVSEVAARVGQFPGHDRTAFEQVAVSGAVHSPWQPPGVTNLDGLLGTGTYQVLPGETDAQILGQMVRRFDQQANAAGLTAGAAAIGLTPYQAVTMASIVEKEGVIAKNVGPVARVILNRLAQNMPLQMDSTVLYAEGRDGGTVTTKDLATVTPYNTYLNKGLTPTPICFPSAEALQATLHPPAGSWLYFVVVQSDGTEAFADTYAQQQANEALAAQRGLP
jgi:UPF0755 protein